MTRIILSLLLVSMNFAYAQLKSPDNFLGYSLGSKYTPHYKIVNYFNAAASSKPQNMKLEKYGETSEGKDLLIAIISSAENMQNIEEIRKNNLRLTGLLTDKAGNANAPAIVWLSYNVHGDEPSSSEVAIKILYELLNPSNPQINNWLKNTVVIIDPCLNPDGRDRYVNWFNQMSGKNADANIGSREHSQPWPGGRTNHYNFDLNRDWAWQSQIETQQRVKVYNEWLPQIHCDYHEQYPSNPYYFAPAAEPMHEVITPWQRSFQTDVGKNHAKYFDANGWLYFTREIFDLFYPSYGDTYPLFNGAIGMTYEQAGHGVGGLAVVKNDGDTLTLKNRIEHHFATSLSTIEIASLNAAKLILEFKKYFDEGNKNGIGEYKTYIVTAETSNKFDAIKTLLTNNKIQFGIYNNKPAKGYNYFSGKEETVKTGKYTLAVNVNQPKAALIKVLFEPKSLLSDSVTYDITGWALPFAYGVNGYAIKEGGLLSKDTSSFKNHVEKSTYGYLVNYASFEEAKLLGSLLSKGYKVRFAEKNFSFNKKTFNKGTLLILRSGNEKLYDALPRIFEQYNTDATGVGSGFVESGFDFGSEKIHLIKKPSVAVLTGNGVVPEAAGEVWHLFDQQLNYPISLINADDISYVNLKNFDVLILPNGGYKFLNDKEGSAEIKSWVKRGGKIIAMEGAAVQLAMNDFGLKVKKASEEKDNKDDYADVRRFENRERESVTKNIPGAIYKVELDDSHPLAFGYPGYYYTLKLNDNIFEFTKDGWNVGVIKKGRSVSGFVGSNLADKITDGSVIAVQPMGAGTIVSFADDPIFRSFWENGKLLFSNAVFFVGQ
ncbi:MAG: M14 family zinc carboxypeptidase [Bacteroidota bacterium]